MAERALATAFVNVVPGTKDFENMLKGQLSGNMPGVGGEAGVGFANGFKSKFAGAIRGVAAPLVAAFGVYQTGEFLKGAIQGASDLNEQAAAVGQVFGKGAGSIQAFAASAASSLGQSNVQVLEASKQFGIYGKAAGLAGEDNAKFSTGMVQLATDLASFNNTSVDDAILAIGSGLRGEAEPLRQYGVLLNDATLKAEAMSMGLIKSTKDALTPQQKVLAAHQVILAQTSTQQGDFARTSDGLANQQRILTAEWSNAQSILGSALMPMFTDFIGYMNTNALPAIKTFFEDFKNGKTPLNDIGTAIGNVTTFVKDNWTWISSLGVGLLTAYAAIKLVNTGFVVAAGIQKAYAAAVAIVNGVVALYKIATGQATLAQLGMNAAMLANPIGLIVAAVAALVAGLIWFFTQTKLGQTIWANFTKFLGEAVKNIGAWFGTVWKGIVTGWNNVVTWFKNLPGVIMGALANAGSWLLGIGKNIIDGLIQGLKNGAGMVGQWFKNMGDAWISQFKSIFGIHSPSKVFKEFGKNIMQGLHAGLTGEKGTVADAMKKVSDWLTNAFNDKKISKAQVQAGRKLVAAYSAQLQKLEAEHSALMERLDAAQKTLADKIAERADYIKGLSEKFGSALTIDTTVADQADIAAAKNDVAKAQAKYNEILKDTEASLTDIEDARLALTAAEKKYAKAKTPGTTAASAIEDLKARVAKTRQLKVVTDQLLALGLNKNLYKQIVETQAVDFGQSIIDGGIAAVSELNVLANEADAAAVDLATKVGDTLFNEGIKFAKSVVEGLEKDKAKLEAIMDSVALAFEKHMLEIVKGSTTAINTAMTGAAAEAKAVVAAAIEAAKGPINMVISYSSSGNNSGGGGDSGFFDRKIVGGKQVALMAAGGFVTKATPAIIGEAGPEVVTPLKDFERMMGTNQSGPSITYVAAPNQSLDSEQALFQAMKRAKVVGAW